MKTYDCVRIGISSIIILILFYTATGCKKTSTSTLTQTTIPVGLSATVITFNDTTNVISYSDTAFYDKDSLGNAYGISIFAYTPLIPFYASDLDDIYIFMYKSRYKVGSYDISQDDSISVAYFGDPYYLVGMNTGKLTITKADGNSIQGTFTGSNLPDISIINGKFNIHLKN